MICLADEAKVLLASKAELRKSFRRKSLKMCDKCRTADMVVATKQTRTARAKQMAQISQLKGDVHMVKGKLQLMERCNKVANSWTIL